VYTPAYLHTGYEACWISESSPLPGYKNSAEEYEWSDDEIAAIRTVLQRLTAVRVMNPNDAEDLVQDTLLTMIMKHPGKELQKGNLVWSMGILRKKVGNYYRRIQRNIPLGAKESRTREGIPQSPISSSPESSVFHKELQSLISRTLSQLPSSQRKAMELLLAGLDPREIVKRLHPERYQNVINRLHRGRKTLAKELAKYGYGPHARKGMRNMKRCRIRKKQTLPRQQKS
jgi:RNA polymerase sigma factor (sigma-70 family)